MGHLSIETTWVLARSKVKDDNGKSYYGGYPAGFLERVRNVFLNGDISACIYHVCSGYARNYNVEPFWGFGCNDVTIDIDPVTLPDIIMDVRQISAAFEVSGERWQHKETGRKFLKPDLILIDRPYGEEEARNYNSGPETCPNLNNLVRDCLLIAPDRCPVLCIDYYWPKPSPVEKFKEYAAIQVVTGRDNKSKVLTAWRKHHSKEAKEKIKRPGELSLQLLKNRFQMTYGKSDSHNLPHLKTVS